MRAMINLQTKFGDA